MRDLFVILGSLLIAALVVAFAVPRFVDWSPYKHEIEARLDAATGLKVTLAGPLRVTLLPKLALNAQDVSIEAPEAAVTAARLRVQVSVASLMSGTPRIVAAELDGAVVKLAGRVTDDPVTGLARMLSSAGPALSVDAVTLNTVSVTGADGAQLASIDRGDVALEQRQGPLRLDLDGAVGGVPGRARLSVAAPGTDGRRHVALALDADAGPRRGSFRVTLDGDTSANGTVAGNGLTGTVPPAADVPVALDGKLVVVQARPGRNGDVSPNKDATLWRAEAKLHALRRLMTFADLDISRERATALRLGGKGTLDLSGPPRLTLDLSARRLVLDPLIGASDRGTPSAPVGVEPALAALAAAIGGAVPPGLTVTFGIGAETAGLAGESFEKLRAAGVAGAAGLSLRELAANWVGRGQVSFVAPASPGEPGAVSGHVQVQSPDAAAFLQGLGLASDANAAPIALDLSGNLARTAMATRLTGLDIALAGSRIGGDMTVSDARAGRPARVDAHLTSADLDLDAWPLGAVTRIVPPSVEGSVEVHVGRLRVGHGTGEAGRLDLAMSRASGRTRVDSLELHGFEGLALTGAGTIGGEASSFELRVAAPKVAPLATLSRLVLPPEAVAALTARGARLEPLALNLAGRRGAAGQAMEVTLSGTAGATRVDAHASLDATFAPTGGDATLSAPDAAALLSQVGLPVGPGPSLGHGEVKVTATPGDNGRVKVMARLAAGAVDASGDGLMSFASGGPAGQGGFALATPGAVVAARLAGWTLPRLGPDQRTDLAGGWTLTPTRLTLDRLNGHIAGGAVTGTLGLALDSERKLTGEMHVPTLSLPAIAALALGDTRGKAGAPWASARFPAYVAPPVPISIDLAAPVAALGWGLAGRDARLTLDIGERGIAITNAAASMADGVVGGDWRIERDGGLARSVLRLSATALRAQDLFPGTGLAGSLTGHAEISGAGETLSAIVATSGGGGTLHVADGTIAQAAPGGLRLAFAKAVADDAFMDKDRLGALVARETAVGPLDGIAFEAPLLVTDGVVKTTIPRREPTPGDGFEGAATIDLKALTLDARLGLSTLSPGDPEKRVPLASVISWKGPFLALKRSADASALLQAVSVERLRLELERIELLEFDQREQGFFNRRLKAGRQKAEPLREQPPAPMPQPQAPDAKPQVPDAKPQVPEAKPQVPEAKPQVPEAKPQVPEAKPQVPEAKPGDPAPPPAPRDTPPPEPEAAPPVPPVRPEPLPAPIVVPAAPRIAPARPPRASDAPTVLHPGN